MAKLVDKQSAKAHGPLVHTLDTIGWNWLGMLIM